MTHKTPTRRLLPLLVALLAVPTVMAAAPSEARAENKIAVVDMRRAVLETEEGLRVQASLKQLFDSRQVELANREKQLMAEKGVLDKDAQAGKFGKEVLQKKYAEWEQRAAEIQKLLYQYEQEMQVKQRELTDPILQRILGLVKKIASQEGFEMVLEKSAVPFARTDLDVTDRAIQMYNSGQTDAPKKPAAPAPPAKPAPKK